MDSALLIHRLHFAFTVTFHYLFPQLTMGLAPLIVILKTIELNTETNSTARRRSGPKSSESILSSVLSPESRWNFSSAPIGLILALCRWRYWTDACDGRLLRLLPGIGVSGAVSSRRKEPRQIGHWFAAFVVFVGSWLSGYFIVATDAWMQHPVGYSGLQTEVLRSPASGSWS